MQKGAKMGPKWEPKYDKTEDKTDQNRRRKRRRKQTPSKIVLKRSWDDLGPILGPILGSKSCCGPSGEKINQMCSQFQPDELRVFHAVKAAFDESRLLNPGKNVPTLARCAEFGAMHVHNGELAHPELPRF